MPQDSMQPVTALTTDATGVTPNAQVVNQAQAQVLDTSGLIASYEQRLSRLMSEKDKAIHERNLSIAQLTDLQSRYTTDQEQTQSSLSAAANSAQQAIDRAAQLERDMNRQVARNLKLAALMQKPHLVPYEKLIPETGDEAQLTQVINELEAIREEDLKRFAPTPTPQQAQQTQQQQAPSASAQQTSLLQSLYGNRSNMNPAYQNSSTPIPASSPAQMNPGAAIDTVSAINQLYAEAKRIGTPAAFEDATNRAKLIANSSIPR